MMAMTKSATGGVFKFFRSYLEFKGLRPVADVPFNLRRN